MSCVNTQCAFMNLPLSQSNQSHLLRPRRLELTLSNKVLKTAVANYKLSVKDSDDCVMRRDCVSSYSNAKQKTPNLNQTTGFLLVSSAITKSLLCRIRGIAKIIHKTIDFDIANCVEGAFFNVNGVAMNLEFQFAQYQVKVNGWGDEQDPIVISGVDSPSAMAAIEQSLINFDMKMKNLEWQLKLSEHLTNKEGRHLAKLTIEIKNTGETKEYCFDITEAFK